MGSVALLLALVIAGSGEPVAKLADFSGGRVCSRTRWCWAAPTPQGLAVRDLWGSAPNDVWAVAEHGTILHYDGKGWSGVVGAVEGDLVALSGNGKADVWAAGGQGQVLHFDGKAWWSVGPETEMWLNGVRAFSAKDVWAAGVHAVFHWDGTRWIAHELPSGRGAFGVFGTGPDNLWFGAGKDTVLRWNGTKVVEVPASLPQGYQWLDFSGKKPWALDASGTLWERGETGTWSHQSTSAPSQLGRVWRRRANDAWGFSKAGAVWHFDGDAWSLGKPPLGFGMPTAVWGTGKDDLWLAGFFGRFRHWNGSEWQGEPPDPCPNPRRMASAGGVLWLAGQGGICRRTPDGTTTVLKEPYGEPAMAVATPDGVWLAGGSLLHWDGTRLKDANQTDLPAAMRHLRFTGVWGAVTGELWAVGEGGVTVRFDGKRWLGIPSGTSGTLHGIWGSSPTDVWAAGDQGVLRWDGAFWSPVAIPAMGKPGTYHLGSSNFLEVPEAPRSQVKGLWGSSATEIWAVGGPVATWKSVDFLFIPGRSVQPMLPSRIDWGTALLRWDGKAWSTVPTGDVTHLSSIWGSAVDDVWAAGGTAILHFDGKAWSREDTGTGLRVTSIAGVGRGDVYVLADRGCLLHRSP